MTPGAAHRVANGWLPGGGFAGGGVVPPVVVPPVVVPPVVVPPVVVPPVVVPPVVVPPVVVPPPVDAPLPAEPVVDPSDHPAESDDEQAEIVKATARARNKEICARTMES